MTIMVMTKAIRIVTRVPDNYNGSCHDRKDGSDDTGLYTCRDGSHVKDWRDCQKDAGKHPDEEEERKEERER